MPKLQGLLKKLPTFAEARMVANGFGVWVCWKTDLNPVVAQTLSDYGGMLIAQERHQMLWFFFSSDVVLALSRIEVWVRFNPIPVFFQVFPAKLLLGLKLEVSLSIDSQIANQESITPDEFQAWFHPKVREVVKGIPGIGFGDVKPLRGLANLPWKLLQADPRLPYQSSLAWYLILKPLGNPLDKAFQTGWREFFPGFEEVLKRMKLAFMIQDFFVLFQLENLRQLRNWCKEFLRFVNQLKEQDHAKYWPCVVAVVEKKGLNFNAELPHKVRLDWELLMPDFPHMSYRTAFLVGEGFKINDLRFTMDQSTLEDWCNISLLGDNDQGGTLQVDLPKRLVTGKETYCFYCGLHSHQPQDCPSHGLDELNFGLWDTIAGWNLDTISGGLKGMDDYGIPELLTGGGLESTLLKAIFEIDYMLQLRTARAVFRSMGKDYPRGLFQPGPMESSIVWDVLDNWRDMEHMQIERMLSQAALKSPRSYPIRTLQGFVAMEKGDRQKAASIWKEAEIISSTPLQHAFVVFLQGRCMELLGRWQVAGNLYKQVQVISPRWLDAAYRQGACLVKMGFAEQAMTYFINLFPTDPHIFNKLLLDSELERGHIHLLSALYVPWTEAIERAVEEKVNLEELNRELSKWFPEKHPFAESARTQIVHLSKLGEIKNYVALNQVALGRQQLSRDFFKKVEDESKRLKRVYIDLMERLRVIQGEASWFPFPKILIDFNKDYNYCAKALNWAMSQHFEMAENFLKANEQLEAVQERLKSLENQLKTLKVVRDSTLFLLIMGKTFFWMELGGLLLALLLLPLGVYYGQMMGYSWASGLVLSQKWDIQKGLIIILSITALAVAALRSALIFERRKDELFRRFSP